MSLFPSLPDLSIHTNPSSFAHILLHHLPRSPSRYICRLSCSAFRSHPPSQTAAPPFPDHQSQSPVPETNRFFCVGLTNGHLTHLPTLARGTPKCLPCRERRGDFASGARRRGTQGDPSPTPSSSPSRLTRLFQLAGQTFLTQARF